MSKHIRRQQNKRQKQVGKLKADVAKYETQIMKLWNSQVEATVGQCFAEIERDKYYALAQKYLRAFANVCEIAGEEPTFVVADYEKDAEELSPTDENGNYK